MVREATCMIRMGLEVPEVATNLLRKIGDLKNSKVLFCDYLVLCISLIVSTLYDYFVL